MENNGMKRFNPELHDAGVPYEAHITRNGMTYVSDVVLVDNPIEDEAHPYIAFTRDGQGNAKETYLIDAEGRGATSYETVEIKMKTVPKYVNVYFSPSTMKPKYKDYYQYSDPYDSEEEAWAEAEKYVEESPCYFHAATFRVDVYEQVSVEYLYSKVDITKYYSDEGSAE